MRYERTLAVLCSGCDLGLQVPEGTKLTREQWDHRLQQVTTVEFQAGESGQPIPVQAAMRFALDAGWWMLTERDITGSYSAITKVSELGDAEARYLTAECPACRGKVTPPYSKAAERALLDLSDSERTTHQRIARLEAEVAALRQAVAS